MYSRTRVSLTWLLFDFPASDFYESFVFLFVFFPFHITF